jgi:hypothetical protein
MRKIPAYKIVQLNVAHSERSQNELSERTEYLPLMGFLPVNAVPLFEIRL